uniref:Uncharacterized protein n=1 Tax=Pavo cristatus TaxID=9049 RepID=A0A8C9FV98_PAVCR
NSCELSPRPPPLSCPRTPCLLPTLYLCPLPAPLPQSPICPSVSMQYNPGWNGSSVNVLHVRAVGRSDALHYVWSSIGAPSVLLVATRSPDSSLSIDWGRLLSPAPAGAVWIDPPGSVAYAAAVVFTKVLLWGGAAEPQVCGVCGGWRSPSPCLNDPRSPSAKRSRAVMWGWGRRSPCAAAPQPERSVQRWSSQRRGDVELLESHRNEGWGGTPPK